MIPIIVDNCRAFSSRLANRLPSSQLLLVDPEQKHFAYDLAAEIDRLAQAEEDQPIAIFLTVSLRCTQFPAYTDCWGLNVLKEIRINYSYSDQESRIRSVPIILISYFSLAQILKLDPKNLIAHSPGTYLVKHTDLKTILKNKARLKDKGITNIKQLEEYFRVDYRLPDERHSHANWWGAYVTALHLKMLYPDLIDQEQINDLMRAKSLQVSIAQLLYETKKEAITVSQLEEYRTSLASFKQPLWNIRRGAVNTPVSKIVLIDDHAEEEMNWKDSYSVLLFQEKDQIEVIPVSLSDDKIVGQLDHSIGCILFDLYLDKQDYGRPAHQTRGAILLAKIKAKFPFTPLIITTASNKSESRKELLKLGADTLWIKESIEDKRTKKDSIKHMIHLADLVHRLTSQKYRFLWQCNQALSRLESTPKLWWEYRTWQGNSNQNIIVQVNRHQIFKLISEELIYLRSYFQAVFLEEGFIKNNRSTGWLPGIIIALASIIEQIHKDSPDSIIQASVFRKRGDLLAVSMYKLRSNAAHYPESRHITEEEVLLFIKALFCYLTISPSSDLRNAFRKSKGLDQMLLKSKKCQTILSTYFPDH